MLKSINHLQIKETTPDNEDILMMVITADNNDNEDTNADSTDSNDDNNDNDMFNKSKWIGNKSIVNRK